MKKKRVEIHKTSHGHLVVEFVEYEDYDEVRTLVHTVEFSKLQNIGQLSALVYLWSVGPIPVDALPR